MELSSYVRGKKIIFGITGGIAAYKAANCVSALRSAGAEVYVVMTENAQAFISSLTLKTLSKHDVITDMFDDKGYVTHISLTEAADLFVVAPATANCLAKMRAGIADDMLSTMLLAFNKDILVVPSMNDNMLENPATIENIEVLKNRGVHFVMPEYGKLATGKIGKGRFPKEELIILKIVELLYVKPLLNSYEEDGYDKLSSVIKGKIFGVTLGATKEYIDPVRYISNGSSGKMGFAFINAINSFEGNLKIIAASHTDERVEWFPYELAGSTEDMCKKVLNIAPALDWLIMSAAPGDYRVENESSSKIKKGSETIELKLVKNPDIITEVKIKFPDLKIIGFAAETDNIEEHALEKIRKKGIEAICVNEVFKDEKGFSQDKNEITLISKKGKVSFSTMDKEVLAYLILFYLLIK
jgi:phosphopantothenoylcysteine decarboxylase/phosphopantothenate--cysteine ligase